MNSKELITFQSGFQCVCMIVVIGYGAISIRDFIQNDDVCEVSFKRFHSDKESIYPSFTICLNTTFVEERLQKISSTINSSSYESYLAGRRETNEHLKNIEYNDVVLKAEAFLLDATVKYKEENGSRFGENLKKITTQSWGWMKGVMKCF